MRRSEHGMTFWTLLVLIALGAFIVLLVMRSVPVYLNHMKVQNAVQKVAKDPESANATGPRLRSSLQRFWDIERIQHLDARDVSIERGPEREVILAYYYEARVPLIANIDLVFYFEDEAVVGRGP